MATLLVEGRQPRQGVMMVALLVEGGQPQQGVVMAALLAEGRPQLVAALVAAREWVSAQVPELQLALPVEL